ncbi:hypothetical protein BDV33DRAFT_203344 [Aspergillus novoparasiticus]|uniref:Uncharacterized protein n=1 Tax=Aspergillus novoparasiticus TaxID=986946 RepID=A0A5N6EVH0_9EURO|nr:hypothetical protein BDV33DRAFT_203344 [Aspergillus novoparasiticus]
MALLLCEMRMPTARLETVEDMRCWKHFGIEEELDIPSGPSQQAGNMKGPLVVSHPGQGQLCGGFRYMRIWHNSTGSVTLRDRSGNFTASPEMENPKKYVGWFNCSGDKLGVGWQDSEWNLRSSGRGEARPHGVAWRRRHLRAVRLCVDQQPQRPTQSGP